jgi:hypothetical protein
MSFDFKLLSAVGTTTANGAFIRWEGSTITPFKAEFYSSPIDGIWHTYIGFFENSTGVAETCAATLYNNTGGSVAIYLSALQVLEFGSRQDALNFIDSKAYVGKPAAIVYGTAIPSTGTWNVGDRVINSVPTVGQPKSWACTVAGTPGTWVSEGNL